MNYVNAKIPDWFEKHNIYFFQILKFEKKIIFHRFVNEIIAAKPRTLIIDFPRKDDAEFFGEEFLLKYAETVEHPKLTLNIRFDREYIRVHGLRFKFAIILIILANFRKPWHDAYSLSIPISQYKIYFDRANISYRYDSGEII